MFFRIPESLDFSGFQGLRERAKLSCFCAINAKQVTVTFNVPVDSNTAKAVTNYSFRVASGLIIPLTADTTATGATSELSADNKTVTITLVKSLTDATSNVFGSATPLKNGDKFQVITKNVKDVAKTQTVANTTTEVTYSDTVAPTLVSASASAKTTTNTVNLVFSEPVDTTYATATVDGKTVSIGAGAKINEVKLTTSALTAGSTYAVSLLNFKDVAGNLTTINPIATTVTVSTDAVAPVITSITPVRNSAIEVTFDKEMNASTITNASLKVLDTNLSNTGITQASVLPKVVNGVNSKTTFVITLTTSLLFQLASLSVQRTLCTG